MTVYRISCTLLLTCLIFLQPACKRFVQVPPPSSGVVGATAFQQNSTAAAVLTSIYTNMTDGGSSTLSDGQQSIDLLCGLSADELISYENQVPYSEFYANSLKASDFNDYFWSESYNYIYVANAALEGLAASTTLDTAVKTQLLGEAKFVRAFFHFYLTCLFGNVPLVTTTNYQANNTLSRTPQAAVYQQLIADLLDAQNLLTVNYWDPSNKATTARVRPNKWAATMMLAKAYLYSQKWDSAAVEATAIINSGMYSLLPDLNSVFLANSNETVWQLQPVYPGVNTFDGYYFILTSPPGTGNYIVALSPFLLNAFEAGDARRSDWVNSYVNGTDTFYYPFKYKQATQPFGATITPSEYKMVLRYAEVYLIRAEAEANLGDSTDAINDLNEIRSRAGLAPYDAAVNGPLMSALLHERQIELFTEWGNRWFDLKRTGNINGVMGIPGDSICEKKGGTWNPDWALFPIPVTEIQINSHLTQNAGY